MNLVCPICQAEYPLAAAMNDVAARQAVVKAFSLTQMGEMQKSTALFHNNERIL